MPLASFAASSMIRPAERAGLRHHHLVLPLVLERRLLGLLERRLPGRDDRGHLLLGGLRHLGLGGDRRERGRCGRSGQLLPAAGRAEGRLGVDEVGAVLRQVGDDRVAGAAHALQEGQPVGELVRRGGREHQCPLAHRPVGLVGRARQPAEVLLAAPDARLDDGEVAGGPLLGEHRGLQLDLGRAVGLLGRCQLGAGGAQGVLRDDEVGLRLGQGGGGSDQHRRVVGVLLGLLLLRLGQLRRRRRRGPRRPCAGRPWPALGVGSRAGLPTPWAWVAGRQPRPPAGRTRPARRPRARPGQRGHAVAPRRQRPHEASPPLCESSDARRGRPRRPW